MKGWLGLTTVRLLGIIMSGKVLGVVLFSCGLNQLYWWRVHTSPHMADTYTCIIQIGAPLLHSAYAITLPLAISGATYLVIIQVLFSVRMRNTCWVTPHNVEVCTSRNSGFSMPLYLWVLRGWWQHVHVHTHTHTRTLTLLTNLNMI